MRSVVILSTSITYKRPFKYIAPNRAGTDLMKQHIAVVGAGIWACVQCWRWREREIKCTRGSLRIGRRVSKAGKPADPDVELFFQVDGAQ